MDELGMPVLSNGIPKSIPICGGVAQLGERQLCKLEVAGSIPVTSTIYQAFYYCEEPKGTVVARSRRRRSNLALVGSTPSSSIQF